MLLGAWSLIKVKLVYSRLGVKPTYTSVSFTIKTGEAGSENAFFYPNPAGSVLFVEWGEAEKLELFDLLGRPVFSKKREKARDEFSVEKLQPGVCRAVFYEKNGARAGAKSVIIRP